MNKTIIITCITTLMIATMVSAAYYYQETENSTGDEGWTNVANVHDGNWDTYGYGNSNNLYFNYSYPGIGTINDDTKINYRLGMGDRKEVTQEDCIKDPIELRLYSEWGSGYGLTTISCYNGADWEVLETNTGSDSSYAWAYETGINWSYIRTPPSSNVLIINNNTDSSGVWNVGRDVNGNQEWVAQSFMLDDPMKISSISLFIGSYYAADADYWIELRTDDNGQPSETLVDNCSQSISKLGTDMSMTDWYNFALPCNATLTANTTYWLVLNNNQTGDHKWLAPSGDYGSNPYLDGKTMWKNEGESPTWYDFGGSYDLAFIAYGHEVGTCNPDWTCSQLTGCTPYRIRECHAVTDQNSCEETFTGSLSDYNQNCTITPEETSHGYKYTTIPTATAPTFQLLPTGEVSNPFKNLWINFLAWLVKIGVKI